LKAERDGHGELTEHVGPPLGLDARKQYESSRRLPNYPSEPHEHGGPRSPGQGNPRILFFEDSITAFAKADGGGRPLRRGSRLALLSLSRQVNSVTTGESVIASNRSL
jgi:hypothetical protein